MLSLDTEQIWGYLDLLDEARFMRRYPDAIGAHAKLLACLTKAGVSATWFLVGGMALRGSQGQRDSRMAGLPVDWTNPIPSGVEATAPLWYRRSFVEDLRKARPFQEIGLHGGLTHLIWTNPHATRDVAEAGTWSQWIGLHQSAPSGSPGGWERVFLGELQPTVVDNQARAATRKRTECGSEKTDRETCNGEIGDQAFWPPLRSGGAHDRLDIRIRLREHGSATAVGSPREDRAG